MPVVPVAIGAYGSHDPHALGEETPEKTHGGRVSSTSSRVRPTESDQFHVSRIFRSERNSSAHRLIMMYHLQPEPSPGLARGVQLMARGFSAGPVLGTCSAGAILVHLVLKTFTFVAPGGGFCRKIRWFSESRRSLCMCWWKK